MKLSVVSSFVLAGFVLMPSIAAALISPYTHASTATPPTSSLQLAQAGQVVASINPNQPIRIEVRNGGGAAIVVRLTQPASAERLLQSGSSTAFGTLTTQYLPPPVHFIAYPQGTNVGLSMDVFTSGNTVTIIIGEQLSNVPGRTSVSIAPNGAVSVF
jgi:hypothetical protein